MAGVVAEKTDVIDNDLALAGTAAFHRVSDVGFRQAGDEFPQSLPIGLIKPVVAIHPKDPLLRRVPERFVAGGSEAIDPAEIVDADT